MVVQSLSRVRLFATPRATAHQASLSFTISQSLLTLTSIESVMPSSHLILCRPLLLPPSIFPSIRVFSSESALHIRGPEYYLTAGPKTLSKPCCGQRCFALPVTQPGQRRLTPLLQGPGVFRTINGHRLHCDYYYE